MGADDTCSPADEYLERVKTLGTTDDRTRTLAYRRFVVSKRDARGKRMFLGSFNTSRKAIKRVRQLETMAGAS